MWIVKRKHIFSLILSMLCAVALSVSVLAADGYYASDEYGNDLPGEPITSMTVDTEDVWLEGISDTGEPQIEWNIHSAEVSSMSGYLRERLTPDGNLSLVDDIYRIESYDSDESVLKDKQFITVETKDGHIFYLIIDRAGDTENVYFLNKVDDADLLALLNDGQEEKTEPVCTCTDKCQPGEVNTDCPVCKNNMTECTGKEKQTTKVSLWPTEPVTEATKPTEANTKKDSRSSTGLLLLLLLILAGGGFAVYWFKFREKKPDAKGSTDLDNYDFGDEDDEEIEYEDDTSDEKPQESNKE